MSNDDIDGRKPWDRLPTETLKQYNYFCEYRDMGVDRSISKVAALHGKRPSSASHINRYSQKNNWVTRCAEYDASVHEQIMRKNEAERAAMAERHIKQSLLMQKTVIERLASLSPAEISASDCSRMYDTAVKIERLSRGCGNEPVAKINIENTVSTRTGSLLDYVDMESLTGDEKALLEKILTRRKRETNDDSRATEGVPASS